LARGKGLAFGVLALICLAVLAWATWRVMESTCACGGRPRVGHAGRVETWGICGDEAPLRGWPVVAMVLADMVGIIWFLDLVTRIVHS